MTEFTLKLSLEQINSIVECMAAGPFRTVAAHIDTFQKQMTAQAKAAEAATQDPSAPAAHPEGG